MEGRNPTIDPHLIVELEIGGSPTIFRLAASIELTKEVGGMDMVDVKGQVDILFAANDWHIYFGSKLQPLSVTVLHYLGGQGYLQIDRSGLAMGVRKEFNLEGSAWIFYGRLYGGGEIDVAAGIQPFYVDARGKVWVGLEAGVKVKGSKYSIISAYAELGGRFRAPPVYVGLHGIASYSLLWGTVSGTWEMTFTYPKNPPEGAADGGVETVPLLAYSTPEQGATDVDRFTSINIKTNMPINEPFQYESNQWYMLTVDDYVDREQVNDSIIVSYGQNSFIPVIGGLKSTLEVQYNPVIIYPPGQSVTYKSKLVLREWNYDTFEPGRQIKEEIVEVTFNTSSENPSFRERVYEVYPSRSTTPVYADTQIYIVSKAIQDGEQWRWQFPLEKLKFEVLDARDKAIAGTIYGNLVTYDEQDGSRRFLTEFKPDEPLKPVRMVEDLTTGVKAPAIQLDDGSYENPFTYLSTEAQLQASGGPLSVMGSDMQVVAGQTVVNPTASSKSPSSILANQRALGAKASETSRFDRRDKSGNSSEPANKKSARNMRKRGDSPDINTGSEESETKYRWFWDGDYRIQVVSNSGEEQGRVFVSRFSLEVPPEGENEHPYGSTAEVVGQSITNPHFYINYTVNQAAFNHDMDEARRTIVNSGLRTLFWENMAREPISYPVTVVDLGSGWGQGVGTHVEWREGEVCGKFDSPYDIEGISLPDGWGWEYIRTVLPHYTQASIYRKAMRGCQSLEAEIAVLEQQLNDYREEAFKRHSVADFKSLELRFSTAAPINWSEVDMRIRINPTFDDEQQTWPYDAWTWQLIKWSSSAACDRGEYVIRSSEDSLDHRLELIPEGDFNGQVMVGYYHYFRSLNKRLNSFGGFTIRERSLKLTNTVNVDGQEFSLKDGRVLYESGTIGRVNTSRPAGSTRTDGLTYEGTVYSDSSN